MEPTIVAECMNRLLPQICQVVWPHEDIFWGIVNGLITLMAGIGLYRSLRGEKM